MKYIEFKVRCDTCGQVLDPVVTPDGVEYRHGNSEDCAEPSVVMPIVTPEQLSALFSKKKAPAKKKAKK